MTFYYSDLGSDFGWHFPDLGRDTSLAMNFSARSLEVFSVGGVSKCQLPAAAHSSVTELPPVTETGLEGFTIN